MPSSETTIRPGVAVIGCGSWGKNLVRNFAELGALVAVCDEDRSASEKASRAFGVPARSFSDIIADQGCTGVAVATPAAAHADHVSAALNGGKHVFVEKPLALSVEAGRLLAEAATRAGRVLMVGHLLHYHPAFIALRDLVRAGRLGTIRHLFSNRLNFGKLRTEEDVIWSFAPHDISMILALVGKEPSQISVEAAAILDPRIFDIADLHLQFAEGATARISVSWLNPYKEQKLVVAGSKAHAVFDDTRPWDEKLTLFDHRVDYVSGRPQAAAAEGARIRVEAGEPLRDECQHFLDCIATGAQPRTGAQEALPVLAVLEAASLAARNANRLSISG